jgi:hypothetical protein
MIFIYFDKKKVISPYVLVVTDSQKYTGAHSHQVKCILNTFNRFDYTSKLTDFYNPRRQICNLMINLYVLKIY